jgi:hypothetical protein
MELTTTNLSLFQTSKSERSEFVAQILKDIENGVTDALKVHLQIKCMEDIIKGVTGSADYKEALLDQAQKHGKRFNYQNAEWEIRETGVSYDYGTCGDVVYDTLARQIQELEAKLKERAEWLKAIPEGGMSVVDEETGETWRVIKPMKKSTTAVAVKLK